MKPQQRLPISKKNKEWKDDSYTYYSGACICPLDTGKTQMLYRAANGELEESDYAYVTNPLNETNPKLLGYPSKMRNYDIISPNINTLVGDYINRQFPPVVFATNSNFDQEQFEEMRKSVVGLLQKQFINKIAAMGGPFNEEQITTSFQEIDKKVKNLPNTLAKNGQTALNYIIQDSEVVRHMRKQFYDYCCIATCYSYKDIIKDSIYYESTIPTNIYYLCSPQVDFIQDGEAVKTVYLMSINEIYDRFQDVDGFTDEVKEWIDTQQAHSDIGINHSVYNGISDVADPYAGERSLLRSLFGRAPGENVSGITVEHLQWRSFRLKYKVYNIDIFGKEQVIEYDERYKPLPGERFEKYWCDQLWEGYEIDARFKLGIRPIEIVDEDNPRFLYNGRRAFTRYTAPQSLVEKGLAYQKKYNIISYQMEATLNKSLDKLIIFPLSLIPDKEGWDENTTMYYAKALSFLFVNDAKPNFMNAINGMKGVDLSLNQYVMQGYQMLQAVKMQWDEVCGISQQRKANISASAGKGVTELAVQRSYVINENHFTEFEEYQNREYEDFINLSKYAFSEGKKATFVNRSGTLETLNIVNPEQYSAAKYGIFLKNGIREANKLIDLKNNAQAFAQNISDPELVAKIINSDNYSEIMEYMSDLSAKLIERAQQSEQSNLQIQQQDIQATAQAKQEDLQFKYYKTDADNLRAERVAIIQNITNGLDEIKPIVDNPDSLKNDQANVDLLQQRQKDIADNFFRLKEVQQKEEELKLKEQELRDKKDIAYHKDATALKNKVSGQK